jgi:hypothetical protein
MLRNRSTPLKLEKKLLITIIFTIMCTTCRQRRCSCRRRCPQPRMDHLRRFRCNSSILWTYCHRPVSRFPRRRLGRQSKYGRRGGDLGGVDNGRVLSVTIKCCVEWCIVLTPTMNCTQTERMQRCPWCGDDVDALDWGAPMPWAMVEWQICRPPWSGTTILNNFGGRGVSGTSTIVRRIL